MKRTLLKIILGFIAFLLGGTISIFLVKPLFGLFTKSEIILNPVHTLFTILFSVILYRKIGLKIVSKIPKPVEYGIYGVIFLFVLAVIYSYLTGPDPVYLDIETGKLIK